MRRLADSCCVSCKPHKTCSQESSSTLAYNKTSSELSRRRHHGVHTSYQCPGSQTRASQSLKLFGHLRGKGLEVASGIFLIADPTQGTGIYLMRMRSVCLPQDNVTVPLWSRHCVCPHLRVSPIMYTLAMEAHPCVSPTIRSTNSPTLNPV